MTERKSLKRRVRTRMVKTGERYTAARHQVLAKTHTEPPPEPAFERPREAPIDPPAQSPSEATTSEATPSEATPSGAAASTPFRGERTSSDDAMVARTGRTWTAWFTLLDAWGAAGRPHPEIARWLNAEHGVDGWWAQELTVGYEMAIGRRRPGQRPNGYSVTASKTVAVPVERLFAAFVDPDLRTRWLPGVSLRLRTATPHRTARFDWEDGATRMAIGFTAKSEDRSTVALEHERLADAEAAERQRAFWRERLGVLQKMLEG